MWTRRRYEAVLDAQKDPLVAYVGYGLPWYRETKRNLPNESRKALEAEKADEVISGNRSGRIRQH